MKKFLTAVAILACTGTLALAGPNAGGTLLMSYTPNPVPAEPTFVEAPLAACLDAVPQAPAGDMIVFYAYAAFPMAASPRLKVVAFGIDYDPAYTALAWAVPPPGSVEIPAPNPVTTEMWPAAGSGNLLGFAGTLTATVNEIYTFAGYGYDGQIFAVTPHWDTVLGGFADDGVPSLPDDIMGFGTLGFGSAVGVVPCPIEPRPGACCFPNGTCEFVIVQNCGGVFQGEDITCEPDNPCPQPPQAACCLPDWTCEVLTEEACVAAAGSWLPGEPACDAGGVPVCPSPTETKTWGQIKNTYR